MVKLGLMSYSLYLWHWPFLSFLRIYKADVGESVRMIAVAVAIVFSFITYTLIEKPLKAQSWSVRKSEKVFQSFGVGQAAVLLTCYLILLSIQFFIRPGNLSDPEHLSDIKPRLYATPSCLLERIDKDYVPKSMRFCNSSAASVSKQGLIVGDSHANVVMDGIVQVSKNMTWHLVAHNSCLPYLGETNNGEVDCGNPKQLLVMSFSLMRHREQVCGQAGQHHAQTEKPFSPRSTTNAPTPSRVAHHPHCY